MGGGEGGELGVGGGGSEEGEGEEEEKLGELEEGAERG